MRKLIPLFLLPFCLLLATSLLPADPGSAQEREPTPTLEPTPAPLPIDRAILPKIEPQLLKRILENETDAVPFIVYLKAQADLATAVAAAAEPGLQAEPDSLTRRRAIVNALQDTARASQFGVLQALLTPPAGGISGQSAAAADIQPLWIVNAIAARGPGEMIVALANRPDVAVIRLDREIELARPERGIPPFLASPCSDSRPAPCLPGFSVPAASPTYQAPEWNIAKIRADLVQTALEIDGSGVVVANIDSGVDWLHPALQTKYRGYTGVGHLPVHPGNWFDATSDGALYPVDGNGHGTHTMGTMVGDNGIGVAPEARWIAVRAFDSSGAALNSWLHAAFQWIMAPNGDPALAPDIVNNSWSSVSGTNTEFQPDVQALLNAGIFPVFSAGNNGPNPGTIGAPASFDISMAVGATTIDDEIAIFSSRGPSPWGRLKPEVSAPGKEVLSSLPGGVYGLESGTSMAAPHVAGLAALLLQASPVLSNNLNGLAAAMTSTATPLGDPVPNNDYGWGLIDAYNAVRSVASVGVMQGAITEAEEGGPIGGATVQITRRGSLEAAVTTAAGSDGVYRQGLAAGTYDAAASAFGYETVFAYNLGVTTGTTTIQDFGLPPKPAGVLFGTVRETGTNIPLVAAITIDGTPAGTTSDSFGNFSLTLPTGVYTVTVTAPVHRVGKAFNVTITENAGLIRNFWLEPAPSILLVDGGQWYQESEIGYYQQTLDDLLYLYDTWRISVPFDTPSDVPAAADLTPYDIVIWSSPFDSPGYVGAGEALESYLEGGGQLLLSGQDVAYFDGGGSFASEPYFRDYLKASYAQDNAGIYTAYGLSEEPFDGLSLTLTGGDGANNQATPDVVEIDDPDFAGPLLAYEPDRLAGLHVGLCTPYRAMFLAFGFESISSRTDRSNVMARAIAWLGQEPAETGVELTPATELVIGNFGQTVTHPVRVRNTGTISDTYHLSYHSQWPATLTPTDELGLGSCQTQDITFTVTVDTTGWHISDTLTVDIESFRFATVTDTATRITKSPAPVLLVDDDRWYSFAAEYREALAANSIPYDYWLVPKSWSGPLPPSPPLETLQMYPMTVWYTAYDWFQPLTEPEEERLVTYLDGGGRLLFSSQDYLYQRPDVENNPFSRRYLGIQDYVEDFTSVRLEGETGNPVGDDLGPYILTFPPGYLNATDALTPTAAARIASRGQYDQPNGLTNGGRGAGGEAWRTNFLAYGAELLGPPERARLMQRSLGWLSWLGSSTVTPNAWAVTSGATVIYTATVVNDGWEELTTATFTATRPPELTWGTFSPELQAACQGCDLVWSGSLAKNESRVFTYTATVADSLPVGTVVKQVTWLAYPDHNLLFDRIATVRVNFPDITASEMTVFPEDNVEAGDTLTYTLVLRNDGLADTPLVTTTNSLPPMLRLHAVDAPSQGQVLTAADGITWTTPLSQAGIATLTYRAVISYRSGAVIRNVAYADDGFSDPVVLTKDVTFKPSPIYLPLIFKN